MKRTVLMIIAFGVLFTAARSFSQNNGAYRELSGYTNINISYSGDITVVQGEKEGVSIEGTPDMIKSIRTVVSGDTLFISKKRSFLFTPRDAKITVYIINIKSIELSSSENLFSEKIESEQFGLKISGSGDVRINQINTGLLGLKISGSGTIQIPSLSAEGLDTDISGSGDVIIAGTVQKSRMKISGSGTIESGELISQKCDIKISGSGDARVYVEELIRVKITGSGEVQYGGKPVVEVIGITGSGSLEPIE